MRLSAMPIALPVLLNPREAAARAALSRFLAYGGISERNVIESKPSNAGTLRLTDHCGQRHFVVTCLDCPQRTFAMLRRLSIVGHRVDRILPEAVTRVAAWQLRRGGCSRRPDDFMLPWLASVISLASGV